VRTALAFSRFGQHSALARFYAAVKQGGTAMLQPEDVFLFKKIMFLIVDRHRIECEFTIRAKPSFQKRSIRNVRDCWPIP
jgi:hypothetical protein